MPQYGQRCPHPVGQRRARSSGVIAFMTSTIAPSGIGTVLCVLYFSLPHNRIMGNVALDKHRGQIVRFVIQKSQIEYSLQAIVPVVIQFLFVVVIFSSLEQHKAHGAGLRWLPWLFPSSNLSRARD